jgi:hypothetical protein
MSGAQTINHLGKKIVQIDFSNLQPEQSMLVMDDAARQIRSNPPASVYTITIVTNAAFNPQITQALKEFAQGNKPYVIAGTVVGLNGMQQIIFNAIQKFSGRKLVAVKTIEDAKKYISAN